MAEALTRWELESAGGETRAILKMRGERPVSIWIANTRTVLRLPVDLPRLRRKR